MNMKTKILLEILLVMIEKHLCAFLSSEEHL